MTSRRLARIGDLILVLCLASIPSFGQGDIVPIEIGATPNLTLWQDAIYFGGQPDAGDFDLFAERGIKTVINLRSEEEVKSLGFDERSTVESEGMRYVQIPVGSEALGEESLSRLMDLLSDEENQPILLHCGSSNRVGYIWALYQGVREGKTVDEAVAEGKAAGLRSPALESRVRQYLADRQQ